jgi:hypothetical protein
LAIDERSDQLDCATFACAAIGCVAIARAVINARPRSQLVARKG